MKKRLLIILGLIITGAMLATGAGAYTKSLSKAEDKSKEAEMAETETTPKVTRGLKQVLINKYGEEIKGNPKYDHGAPDRDLLEEEMTESRTYYRYVYDDALTPEENHEQWLELEKKAHQDYLERNGWHTITRDDPRITDTGIATSEGTISFNEQD